MNKNTLFESVQTPIKPSSYGKAERKGRLSTKLNIQLFKATKTLDRIIANMSKNGIISFYILKNMNLANNTTNDSSLALRPVLVSIPLETKHYKTSDNRIIFNNSVPEMSKLLFNNNSPYNSAIIKGSVASLYIPHFINNKTNPELNWDSVEHNKHAKLLALQLSKIAEKNLTDSDKEKAYTKAWESYQAAEQALIDSGLLVKNMVIVVDQNGLIPTISVNQYSAANNKFFDAKALFGNENSTATYAPMLNSMHGIVEISDNAMDENTNWVYGINTLNENSGIKATSKEVKGYDFINDLADSPMRVIVNDTYGNKGVSEGNTRSERFLDFSENHTFAEISDAELSLGYSKGGLTSIFSMGGDSLYYKAYTPTGTTLTEQESINTVDLDKDLEFISEDLVSMDDISLEDTF